MLLGCWDLEEMYFSHPDFSFFRKKNVSMSPLRFETQRQALLWRQENEAKLLIPEMDLGSVDFSKALN